MLTLGCAANRSSDGGRLKGQSRRRVGADLVAASGDDQPPRHRPSRGWVSGEPATWRPSASAAGFVTLHKSPAAAEAMLSGLARSDGGAMRRGTTRVAAPRGE